MSQTVKLKELEKGSLFKFGETYALKTQYTDDFNKCECYIIGSGESFWGGVSNPNELDVEPVDFEELLTHQREWG